MTQAPKTSVLYNAECPVCNFEISHYASYSQKSGLPIRFDDLNTDARTAWNLTEDQAARRLYVLHDGELTSGIPAFLVLAADATLPLAGPHCRIAGDQAACWAGL